MATSCTSLKITKTVADRATRGDLPQKLYLDTELKGFGLCVGAKAKTFFVRRLVSGRDMRVTIDRYGVLTVEEARGKARKLLERMREGVDPVRERRSRDAQGITLAGAWEMYQETLKSKGRAERTGEGYRQSLHTYLKDWLSRPLGEISRADVRAKHKAICTAVVKGSFAIKNKKGKPRPRSDRSGMTTANHAFRVFRAVYNRAMKQHPELPSNPCINVDWFKVERRRTALPPEKLRAWHDAISRLPNPVRRDYLRFVLFTGQRRQSAATTRWEHVDVKRKVLHIPNPKGGKAFDLPLTEHLVELLTQRRLENEELAKAEMLPTDSPWVFPAYSEQGHISEPRVDIEGVPFTIHDLRRTFITVAESLDISPYAIKALVNHRQPGGDVTAGYIAHDVDRLRGPMQEITNRLLAIVATGARVVPIRQATKA